MMSYWVLFIGIAVVSWLVQMNLQNKFKKYSKIPTGNGMTGRDVALKMLHDNELIGTGVTCGSNDNNSPASVQEPGGVPQHLQHES